MTILDAILFWVTAGFGFYVAATITVIALFTSWALDKEEQNGFKWVSFFILSGFMALAYYKWLVPVGIVGWGSIGMLITGYLTVGLAISSYKAVEKLIKFREFAAPKLKSYRESMARFELSSKPNEQPEYPNFESYLRWSDSYAFRAHGNVATNSDGKVYLVISGDRIANWLLMWPIYFFDSVFSFASNVYTVASKVVSKIFSTVFLAISNKFSV